MNRAPGSTDPSMQALLSLYRFQSGLTALNNMVTLLPMPRRAAVPVEEAKRWEPRSGFGLVDVQLERTRLAGPARDGIEAAHYLGEDVSVISRWDEPFKPWPNITSAEIERALSELIARVDSRDAPSYGVSPPEPKPDRLAARIWEAAADLWSDGHHQQAVGNAAEALVSHVKRLTNRFDVAETAVWQEAFSTKPPAPGKPRLRWPGDPDDRSVKSMNEGLRLFAPGAQMAVRNPAIHGDSTTRQVALEQLHVLSYLSRLVDDCVLEEA